MVKTQVQIPDHLYREAKRIASEREMSFAEVVRRGIEIMALTYPPLGPDGASWQAPEPQELGWKGLTADALRDLANE
jgi:hypothetical protein